MFLGELFIKITDVLNFLGNMCVVAITIYTFYLTFLSKRVKVLGCSETNDVFYGTKLSFTVHNYSMQAFDISDVYLIYGKDHMVPFALWKSVVLEPRKSLQIEIPAFTRLAEDVDMTSEDYFRHWCIVLKTYDDLIVASPGRWCNGWHIKHSIKKNQFKRIGVVRHRLDGIVVSEQVAYGIRLCYDDVIETILMTGYGYTNKAIGGCNDFGKYVGHWKRLRKIISKKTGLPKESIFIKEMFSREMEGEGTPLQVQLLDDEIGQVNF